MENNPVFANEFSKIILSPERANFKINPTLLKRAEWTDPKCTDMSENC